MKNKRIAPGDRFGRLVTQRKRGLRAGHRLWECVCDCGGTKTTIAASLYSGHTQSCGCLTRVKNAAHARSKANNRYVTIAGQTKLLCEWSEATGLSMPTLRMRLAKGWSDQDILRPPLPYGQRLAKAA